MSFSDIYTFLPDLFKKKPNNPNTSKDYFADYYKSGEHLNFENTNYRDLWKIVSQEILKHTIDITKISIDEILVFIGKIVGERITYGVEQARAIENSVRSKTNKIIWTNAALNRQMIADHTPVHKIMEWKNVFIWVCRNYTRAFSAVFDTIRWMQKDLWKWSLLDYQCIAEWTRSHDLCVITRIKKWLSTQVYRVIDPTNMDFDLKSNKERKAPDWQALFQVPKQAKYETLANYYTRLLENNGSSPINSAKWKGVLKDTREQVAALHEGISTKNPSHKTV